jgi:hypothetical protein
MKKPTTKRRQVLPPIRVSKRADYERLSPKEQEARHRAFEAISLMRSKGTSLKAASKFVGTTPATVRRYANDAIIHEGHRYYVTESDRSYQYMSVLSTNGVANVDTRGSRVRSLIGRHWNAIRRFGETGDVELLKPFIGKRVGGVELATDPGLIEEYIRQGELDIDDIYA